MGLGLGSGLALGLGGQHRHDLHILELSLSNISSLCADDIMTLHSNEPATCGNCVSRRHFIYIALTSSRRIIGQKFTVDNFLEKIMMESSTKSSIVHKLFHSRRSTYHLTIDYRKKSIKQIYCLLVIFLIGLEQGHFQKMEITSV